jgi:hypothetical protein
MEFYTETPKAISKGKLFKKRNSKFVINCVQKHRKQVKRVNHRVDRVLGFSPVVRIGTYPLPRRRVCLPPLVPGAGGTLTYRRGGGGEGPNFARVDNGHILWYTR